MLAVAGLDDTVKIFSPDAIARRNARQGIGLAPSGGSGNLPSDLGRPCPRARRLPRLPNNNTNDINELIETATPIDDDGDDEDDDDIPLTENGLPSCKKMHLEYQITSHNDEKQKEGDGEMFMTVSLATQVVHICMIETYVHDREACCLK